MKRLYTVEFYRDMLARCRETVPGVAVSSDFIVGFCGETEESFEKTCDLVERARFKNSFIFKYSPRPGTKADDLFADDVPEEVKKRRNNDLLAIQTAISLEDNRPLRSARRVEVLVEGPSKSSARREGRGGVEPADRADPCDQIVVFEGNERLVGQIVPVEVEDASAVTLFGRVVTIGLRDVAGVKRSEDGEPVGRPGGPLGRVGRDRPRPGAVARRAGGAFRPGERPVPSRGRPAPDRGVGEPAWLSPDRGAARLAACSPTGSTRDGPMIHPLSAIGPMVPFARVPELLVQPESWFELGNPNVETVCIDLAYRWPKGDCPIFTSGDDRARSRPRVIATSFEEWFLRVLHHGGRRVLVRARVLRPGRPLERASPSHARPAAAGSPPAAGASGHAADPAGGRRPLDRHDAWGSAGATSR